MSNEEHSAPKKIFISHKLKDKHAVEKIVNELTIYASGKLNFILSEQFPFGDDWEEKIHKELTHADWLILLYTDPTSDWDWCLYETGFYMGSGKKKERRMVCMHSKEVQPPKPLKKWKSVPAEKEEIIKLLNEIYEDINPHLLKDQGKLGSLAEVIIEAIGPRPKYQYYNNYLLLSLEQDQVENLLTEGKVPQAALVEANRKSLQMFGLQKKFDGQWTWGEIVKEIQKTEQVDWTKNLGRAMRAASIERIFPPGLPLFNSAHTKKIYRPVLYRLDRMPSDIQGFKLIFIEIPNEEDPRPVGALGTVSKLMTMARKFHWGIIEKYRNQLQGLVDRKESEEKINECLEALDSALAKIESESVNLGFFSPECITPAFSGQGDKNKINEIAKIWPDLRKALSEKNLENLINIMDKMRKMTKGFLIIASQNYHDLLKQMDD